MDKFDSRISTLEERVFVSHTEKIEELVEDVKSLTTRLNYLLIILAGNFGVSFLKILPILKGP
jgi:hypothetical protein